MTRDGTAPRLRQLAGTSALPLSARTPSRLGWRSGLSLGAVVLGAHLLLLQAGLSHRAWMPASPDGSLARPLSMSVVATPATPRTVPPVAPVQAHPVRTAPRSPARPAAPDAAPPPAADTPVATPEPAAPARPDDAAARPPPDPANEARASAGRAVEALSPASAPVLAQAGASEAVAPVATETAPARPPRELSAPAKVLIPPPARLRYRVEANKFPFVLSSELLWQHDGRDYATRLSFSAFGQSRVQTSRGQLGDDGLLPVRFSDKTRSEVAAHFNRSQGRVMFSANTPDAPLLAGAQDRLSVLLQLGALLAGDPARYPAASTLTIQTIGPRDADTWLFTVGETETLELPGGTLQAVRLVRNPRKEFDQRVEIWLAPAQTYLPVRVRITDPNGDRVDQLWLGTEAPS